MPPTEQYDDPIGETRQQFLQGLATMSTVGEAAARWAAVGIQQRAGQAEAAAAAHREAAHLADKVRAERKTMAAGLNGDWLTRATFIEVASVWRTATVHAAADSD